MIDQVKHEPDLDWAEVRDSIGFGLKFHGILDVNCLRNQLGMPCRHFVIWDVFKRADLVFNGIGHLFFCAC